MTIKQRSSRIFHSWPVRLTAVTFAVGLAIGIGCSPARKAQTQSPEPNLCDLDDGRWCQPCGGLGEPACPQEGKSGWLCCGGSGVCVAVPTLGDCDGGTAGWCANYTETKECTASGFCTDVAVCHDEL